MSPDILPMSLGDIFDNTFRMIGRTLWRNAAIALSFLTVPIILFTIAANRFYASMPDWGDNAVTPGLVSFTPIFTGSLYFGISSLIFSAAVLFAEIAVSIVIGGEMNSQRINYPAAVRMTFEGRWLNGIAEGALKIAIMLAFGILASVLGGVIVLMVGKGLHAGPAFLVFFAVLFIIMIVIAALVIMIRLYFALTAVAIEDLGPINALKKSWFLVGGHWWRTFGILILFFILSGFAVTLLSIPVTFGSMWNQYRDFFMRLGATGGGIELSQLHHLQAGMGKLIGISSGLSSFLSLLLTPAFTVVMYFDLRARHDDLPGHEQPDEAPEVPLVSY